ncbi:hypothetical protein ILYODFUR_000141 [Ilyodon furcidens]|uniref:Uncharacterized protein n=1 Tax=Ilyodon furcidens TaxID=33524 RepID=A0ABV0U4D6_9TELE
MFTCIILKRHITVFAHCLRHTCGCMLWKYFKHSAAFRTIMAKSKEMSQDIRKRIVDPRTFQMSEGALFIWSNNIVPQHWNVQPSYQTQNRNKSPRDDVG